MKLWCALLLLAIGCASEVERRLPVAGAPDAERQTPAPVHQPVTSSTTKVAPVAVHHTAPPAADQHAVAEATALFKRGLSAYHLGAYDEAETLLKQSITAYPFLAPANLALGKIFLLKGAAHRDESLIESARLMFDMAHNLDPSLREPLVLLELFKPR